MTSDVELLPMPKYPVDGAGDEDSYNTGWNDCLAECRANVAHATAAKDAEIEALRAEVAAVWNAMPSGTRYLDPPDGGDVPLHEQVRRMAADAVRAERLAEALRECINFLPDRGVPGMHKDTARAALRDHDQEVRND